jgi:hypothetical protein
VSIFERVSSRTLSSGQYPDLSATKEIVTFEVAAWNGPLCLQAFDKSEIDKILNGDITWLSSEYDMVNAVMATDPFEGGQTKKCFEVSNLFTPRSLFQTLIEIYNS